MAMSRPALEDEFNSILNLNKRDGFFPAKYFCHVTHRGCETSIRETGLRPRHSVSKVTTYDEWLVKVDWVRGTWFVIRSKKQTRSSYPYNLTLAPPEKDIDINLTVYRNNPMISLPTTLDFIKNLRDFDWFLVSNTRNTNILLACISRNHPKRKEIKNNTLDMDKYEYLQIDNDGNYYVPPENVWISVFVIGEQPIPVTDGEWDEVGKILAPKEEFVGDRVVNMTRR